MSAPTPSPRPLAEDVADTLVALEAALDRFAELRPGARSDRQPVHVVYGGADRFKRDTPAKLGALARASLDRWGADPLRFARIVGMPEALAETVHARVCAKLEREPVEDFRIDFEDGFGHRSDADEDAAADAAASELAAAVWAKTAPPFFGIRIKPLDGALMGRAIRTLDRFVTGLVEDAGGLPENFVVTLPKVAVPEQVSTLVRLFEALERRLDLADGALQLELMVELGHALFDEHGAMVLPQLLRAAEGRCRGAHFGTYDFTASFGVTAEHQRMDHPAAEFALMHMQAAFAETGVWLADGATTVLPLPVHRAPAPTPTDPDGGLDPDQREANRAAVHRAWRLAYANTQRSLARGFYQGWDLHPAQLPVRYAAVHAFFLADLDAHTARLRNFIDQAAQATRVGEVFDDAATGQGLLNSFLRAIACGAVDPAELAATGLSEAELRTRSFAAILAGRAPG